MAAEGVYLGTYKFGRYLTGEDAKRPTTLKLRRSSPISRARSARRAGPRVRHARSRAAPRSRAAINHARDLDQRARRRRDAGRARRRRAGDRQEAQGHVTIEVLGAEGVRRARHGHVPRRRAGLRRRSRASSTYVQAEGQEAAKKKIALIGKGVTFDSGGLLAQAVERRWRT